MQTKSNPKTVWTDILRTGFARIPQTLPRTAWSHLYEGFDDFTSSLGDAALIADFNSEAKRWQKASGLQQFFGGYFSPYYRDTTNQAGKDQKRILQICEPFYRFVYENGSPLLENEKYRRVLDGMMAALYSTMAGFEPYINALKEIDPKAYRALVPQTGLPPVALRLLSYSADAALATNPHVDKSAITIIADTDDSLENSKLVYCGSSNSDRMLMLSDFKSFDAEAGECVVFLGAALEEAGHPEFKALPHAVQPVISSTPRHSAVFFWLLPGQDMETFNTTVPFEDNLGLARAMKPKKASSSGTGQNQRNDSNFVKQQAAAYDQLLPVYEARHEHCQSIRKKVAEWVLDGLASPASALDVGCGAGAYLELLASHGVDAHGIDISNGMSAAAGTRSGRTVTCGDFRTHGFEREFDLVFAQAVVHLFPKTEVLAVVERLKVLAKKRVYFSTSLTLISSEGWEEKDGVSRYRSRYTKNEFMKIISLATQDGAWRARTFELIDPDSKLWLQVILDRIA